VKPVEQTTLYDGTGKRGNCVAACVASIFERPLDELEGQGIGPGCSARELMEWTRQHAAGLCVVNTDHSRNFRIVENEGKPDERWAYDLPTDDEIPDVFLGGCYWIATVVSPRGVLQHGPYRGSPVLHAVVMRGHALVWDPHPQRYMGVGQLVGRTYWLAADPARCTAC
jgi:hypothetical protein